MARQRIANPPEGAGKRLRQLGLLLFAFAGGTALAAALGAANLGVALGVGQVCFLGALVWALLKD